MSNNIKENREESRLINVGHNNYVVTARIVAILDVGSLPVRRFRDSAAKGNLLVDATAGRKTRSVIVTNTHHVVLSALAPQTLHDRLSVGPQTPLAELEVREGQFVS